MNFPGTNSMTLSADTIIEAVRSQIPALHGAAVRVISAKLVNYPYRLEVEFTTDPAEPAVVENIAKAA